MTDKIKNNLIDNVDQVKAITQAIAFAVDSRDVEEALQDLGLNVQVDTIDASDSNPVGQFTIEGGENETGFIATVQIVKLETGFNTLTIEH